MKIKAFCSMALFAASFNVAANPCFYMIKVVEAGFKTTKYSNYQYHAVSCSSSGKMSSSCKDLVSKYGVDIELFFDDELYRKFLSSLAINEIQSSGEIAIDYTVKMLDDIEGELKSTAVDEISRLSELKKAITVKKLTKSLNRMKGVGLCR
ncbi:hypothetical protein BTO01_24150 [Vibrio jasicida]|uniref:hypothetical protein n=1 Tax=Vibrio jasicida TaxID=766224 RepID=UPI000CF539EE|nr:hypothetical protein [Vibrio jasicida]PQJ50463.1 hypothetical protein BTO01_24150 [Vibrio jasicida]